MIAVYGGDNKPTPEELLQVTIEELKELSFLNPTGARSRGYFVKIRQVRGDRPARSVLKGIVGHTGYVSCERCLTKGRQPLPGARARIAARFKALQKALSGHAGQVRPTADGAQQGAVEQATQLGTDQQEQTPRSAARQTKKQTAESKFRRMKVGAALRRVPASPRQAEPNARKNNKRRMPQAHSARRESNRPKRQKRVNYAPQVNDSDEDEDEEEDEEEEMEVEEEEQTAGGDGEEKGGRGTVVFPDLDAPLRSMADWEQYKLPVAIPTGKKHKVTGEVSGKTLNFVVSPYYQL